jgi:hypothetical protein
LILKRKTKHRSDKTVGGKKKMTKTNQHISVNKNRQGEETNDLSSFVCFSFVFVVISFVGLVSFCVAVKNTVTIIRLYKLYTSHVVLIYSMVFLKESKSGGGKREISSFYGGENGFFF